jgi:hypothetical protein
LGESTERSSRLFSVWDSPEKTPSKKQKKKRLDAMRGCILWFCDANLFGAVVSGLFKMKETFNETVFRFAIALRSLLPTRLL